MGASIPLSEALRVRATRGSVLASAAYSGEWPRHAPLSGIGAVPAPDEELMQTTA